MLTLALVLSPKHGTANAPTCDVQHWIDARDLMIGISATAFPISFILFCLHALSISKKITSSIFWKILVQL